MATSETNKASKADLITHAKDAHYHPVKATAHWKVFMAAMQLEAAHTPDARQRRSEQREDETTYARGELGRH